MFFLLGEGIFGKEKGKFNLTNRDGDKDFLDVVSVKKSFWGLAGGGDVVSKIHQNSLFFFKWIVTFTDCKVFC